MGEVKVLVDKDANGDHIFGVTAKSLIKAIEVCGDTSVLEKLYPGACKTEEVKEALDKKKADAKAQKDTSRKEHFKNMAESETKMDVDKNGVVTIQMNTKMAEVLRSVVGCISGAMAGPRGKTDRIYEMLGAKGIKLPRYLHANHIDIEMPDTMMDFDAEGYI